MLAPVAFQQLSFSLRRILNWQQIQQILQALLTHNTGFTMQHQQQTQWCWSATSVSTSHFYNSASAWTQCSLVNSALGQTSCCVDGSTSTCNQPNVLTTPLSLTGNLATYQAGTISFI